jgi:hypothetical protein
MKLRAQLITALAGLITPLLLIEILTRATIYLWFPASMYLWDTHRIKVRELPVDPARVIDGSVSAILGCAIGYSVARLARWQPVPQWLLFAASFLVTLTLPTLFDHDYEALVWFITRPFFSIFLVFAASGFWLESRRHRPEHVA